jgi:xanthine dehydrogenase iron-sulfur cluster and FAD-binding subunit A
VRLPVSFSLNGKVRRLEVDPEARLLDVLREDLRLTGAKEGCGKGECGACTVLVDGAAVDSCLMLAWQADGAALETIEGLGPARTLDPLQDEFVEKGGVQCGICIPGMVMAARALLLGTPQPSAEEIREGLAGNLCRCTGYTKIFAAVAAAAGRLTAPGPGSAVERATPTSHRPRTVAEACALLRQEPLRTPLAGGTDVLVQAKDGTRSLDVIDITGIAELRAIEERDGALWIGAGATHTDLMRSALVARYAPALPQACAVIGGPQIRNRGTIGGNLANASPAADTVPALYVAEAVVEIAGADGRRELPVESFCRGRRETALEGGELIAGVRIPRRDGVRGTFLRLGQRQAQAISKVSVAVAWQGTAEKPERVRVAYGAVAPTVVRAPAAEALLEARGVGALAEACAAAADAVRPIDDLRSTARYRRAMVGVLLDRAVRATLG